MWVRKVQTTCFCLVRRREWLLPSHVACVGLNSVRNNNITLGLGHTKGEIICILNGNPHRLWHDSVLSIQLGVIVLATVYCEFSCNVDHTWYLIRTHTSSNLQFQLMSCTLRPITSLDYYVHQYALAADIHSWSVATVVSQAVCGKAWEFFWRVGLLLED